MTDMETACQWIRDAASIAVLTGAGVSAESGIPAFRGAGGLWRNFRAEDLATPGAFARDPRLVWEWYDWRRGIVAAASPNAGHLALAAMQARAKRFTLITQNVDGLHDRAGSTGVLKLHGDIWTLRCTACAREWRDVSVPLAGLPPRCECGGMARPAIVWFGESLPERVWADAVAAVESCDVLIVAGTSAVVYPAAGLAGIAGGKVIEVNPEMTAATGRADCALRGASGEVLPALVAD